MPSATTVREEFQATLSTMADQDVFQSLNLLRGWQKNGGEEGVVALLGLMLADIETEIVGRGLTVPEA